MTTITQIACVENQPERPCFRARVARSISARIMTRIPARVELAGGEVLGDGSATTTITVANPAGLFSRMGHEPIIGFGDSYMAGDWRAADGTDLGVALTVFAQRITTANPGVGPEAFRPRRAAPSPAPAQHAQGRAPKH
jgi:cyclopropane-fatty-acyl-phospholipid synthase